MGTPSRSDLRQVVASVGGEAVVTKRIGVSERAVFAAYDTRQFPARWYGPMCELADEAGAKRPDIALFNMRDLLPAEAESTSREAAK